MVTSIPLTRYIYVFSSDPNIVSLFGFLIDYKTKIFLSKLVIVVCYSTKGSELEMIEIRILI